jgi:hypothetical protein
MLTDSLNISKAEEISKENYENISMSNSNNSSESKRIIL